MPYIYNVFAELCSYVIRSAREGTFFHYSCISASAKTQILKSIYHEVNGLFASEITREDSVNLLYISQLDIRRLTAGDLDEAFYRSLNAFISRCKEHSDIFSLIALIQVLDESLENLIQDKISEYQSDNFSIVLNTNREITGIGLLPRCSCCWERRHRLYYSNTHLDNYLFHLLLLENSVLEDLVDVHYYLKDDFFPSFSENGELRIAATPLRLEQRYTTEYYEEDNVQYFRITYGNQDFDPDNELIWQKIIRASENSSDIILFPELQGNPQTVRYVQERLRALSPKDRASIPAMIILPSVWDRESSQNTVTVLDRNGRILCRQGKQMPFRMDVGGRGYLEGIRSSQVVHIFHYKGIGRIAILICKDFLMTGYMEKLMRSFKLSLIIVPSFSTGSYDFRQSFDLCAHDDCNVIWINSCAAMSSGKENNFINIGYVRKRIGRSDDEAQKLYEMPICDGAFHGECRHDCLYFDQIKGV